MTLNFRLQLPCPPRQQGGGADCACHLGHVAVGTRSPRQLLRVTGSCTSTGRELDHEALPESKEAGKSKVPG